MLKVAVLVSGGGTNLQAILDAIDNGTITNAKVEVVISNNKNAYALERAKNHGIEALCISPKDYETRDAFNEAFLEKLDSYNPDLSNEGSDRIGGIFSCNSGTDDRKIQEPYHQHSSVPDSVFLWNRLLRIESA